MEPERGTTWGWTQQALAWGWASLGHLVGVALIAAAILCLTLSSVGGAVELVRASLEIEQIRGQAIEQLGGLVALSAALWALLVWGWRAGQRRLEAQRGRRRVRLSRGAIITETLVSMPPFFLLTFGLAQLSINMVGGMLANIAGYQASRAIWLWQPEEASGRMGTGEGEAIMRARIAAALVMTPVTPGDYQMLGHIFSNAGGLPDQADAMRRGMSLTTAALSAAGQATGSSLGGLGGLNDLAVEAQSFGTSGTLTFFDALGSSNFQMRGLRKFTRAFTCAQVEIQEEGDQVGASLTFHHYQGMPFVGPIMAGNGMFRTPDTPSDANGNQSGYYLKYRRAYMFRKQMAQPNRAPPDNSVNASPPDYDEGAARGEVEGGADNACAQDPNCDP